MEDFTGSKYTLKVLIKCFGQDGSINQSLTDEEHDSVEVQAASMTSSILKRHKSLTIQLTRNREIKGLKCPAYPYQIRRMFR